MRTLYWFANHRVVNVFQVWVVICFLGGCINTVTVEKYTASENGFRYALPKPYLLVTPRLDGGIDVQPIMLPDASNEYVIRTSSILSSYKHDLEFEHGLLKSVTGKQDTSALAAQIATNTGAVMKSRVEAQIAARTEAEKKKADARTEGEKKKADAAKAVNDAQIEFDQANAELEYLKQAKQNNLPVKEEQIIEAEIKARRAKEKLHGLSVSAEGAFDLPGLVPGSVVKGQAWGPMLFAVIEKVEQVEVNGQTIEKRTVALQAVNNQEAFNTIALPVKDKDKPGTAAAAAARETKLLSLKTALPLKPDATTGKIVFSITSTKGLAGVEAKRTSIRNKQSQSTLTADKFSMKLKDDDDREIVVTITEAIPSGKYLITPALVLETGRAPVASQTLEFEVKR
jgi:hypothetical protein